MAQYGYSTPFQGSSQNVIPPGYLQAMASRGEAIGQGLQTAGNVIGQALQRYGERKAENEFLTARLESLAPYLQSVAGSGNVMDERSPESKLLGDIEKFSSMSIPQKKATLLNAEFYLDRADKQRARDIQDQLARQNIALGELQLSEAQRRAQLEQNIGQAIGQVAGIPTSRTVNVDQPPAFITSSLNIPAAEQPYTPPYQVQQVPIAVQQPLAAAQAQQGPMFGEYGFGPRTPSAVAQYAQGLGRGIMPIPAGTTREQFTPAAGAQAPTVQPSVGIAPIQQRETPLFESGPIRTTAQQEQAVPFQERFRQATDIFQKLNVPLNVETINKVLEATGTPAPIRATETQLPSGATVISANGRIEVLPPPKPVEGKDLTEGQANAAGFAARMVYNENLINKATSGNYKPGGIFEFGFTPERLKSDDRKTYEASKENWIAANLRKESGAAIGEKEYADADRQYFPQPGDSQKQVQEKANRRKVAERSMRSAIGRNSEFYIQQILGGAQEQQPSAASGGIRRYNPLTKKFE